MSAGGAQTTSCDGAWDPLRGCSRCSKGCKNCPALARLQRLGLPIGVIWPNLVAEQEKIHDRCRVKPGGLYLVCAESDLFHPDAEPHWMWIVEKLRSRPDVRFFVLTKRPDQAKKFVAQFGVLPNLWLGISVEDQWSLDERLPELFSIPAAGYVLSCQPLLGPLFLTRYLSNKKLRYVIAGCELGDRARPCKKAWLDQIEARCRRYGVEYFCTRWRDEHGKVYTSPTRNGPRNNNRKDRPGYAPPARRHVPTVGSMFR